MANITTLLNTIKTAVYGHDMRTAIHDTIKNTNDDLETQKTNLPTNVRSTTLTDLSTSTNSAITASDTVLSGLGKLQAQTNAKESAIAVGTTTHFWRGDKSWQDIATAVRATTMTGLSTATNAVITSSETILVGLGKLQAQTLALQVEKADLVGGKIPQAQLPSYVDDVLEYASFVNFPATGESGKIYIAQDSNKTYRWSSTQYVEISQSLALGETSSTAYAGNKGRQNADNIVEMQVSVGVLEANVLALQTEKADLVDGVVPLEQLPPISTAPTLYIGDTPLYATTFVDMDDDGQPVLREDGRGDYILHMGMSGDVLIKRLIPYPPVGENLALNPDFSTGDFTGWNTPSSPFSITTEQTYSGIYAVKCIGTGNWNILSQEISVTPYSDYMWSFWIRQNSLSGLQFRLLRSQSVGGGIYVDFGRNDRTPNNTWIRYVFGFNSGNNTSLVFTMAEIATNRTSYIDAWEVRAI